MPETGWQTLPQHLHSEMRFNLALLIAHRQIFDQHFAADPSVNRALGFHLNGYRRQGQWRIIQILTPWMLANLWFADSPPEIALPESLLADPDHQPLGPVIDLPEKMGGGKAHLNYHPTLGHYFVQPLSLNLADYDDAQSVFEALSQADRAQGGNG